jgi:hypothetical protein
LTSVSTLFAGIHRVAAHELDGDALHGAEEQVDARASGIEDGDVVGKRARALSCVLAKSSVMNDSAANPSGATVRRCSGTSMTSIKPAVPLPRMVMSAPSDGGHFSVVSSTSPGTRNAACTLMPATSVRNLMNCSAE